MNIYDTLKELNIEYEELSHKAVYTIEEALNENIQNKIDGIECKNLFVKSNHNYYLILLEGTKRADLKKLANLLNVKKLIFSSQEELNEILKLARGNVTPMGIINDHENKVTLLIDKDLENQKLLVHPNINTKTISITYNDLLKFIEYTNHKYITF